MLKPGISVHSMVKDPPLDRLAMLVDYLRPYIHEWVVVDTGSPSEVVEKMQKWPKVRVTLEPFVNFSETRNKGLDLHEHEWTLVLDPDELPSPEMVEHIRYVTSPEGMREFQQAWGWVYWTRNWWDGTKGPEFEYHWHTRLWLTTRGRFYRPVHELVKFDGSVEEGAIRGQPSLPFAPRDAYLIHSKGAADIEQADALYRSMGEVSR